MFLYNVPWIIGPQNDTINCGLIITVRTFNFIVTPFMHKSKAQRYIYNFHD